jgi:copper(I)-binding protein
MRNSLAALCLCLCAMPALAHVTITPATAPPGTRVNATFRIGHGCGPTATTSTALQVELPLNLTAVQPSAPPGWEVTVVRANDRVSAVTWKGGEVKEGQVMLFPISFVLPKNESQLAFPAVQFCGTQKAEWTELPRGTEKLTKPAPLLTLAAASTLPAAVALTVHDGWFRALPGNIPAGGYFILSNGGKETMVLTGAESPGCGMIMMHRSSGNGGMSSMQHVTSRDIPAGGSISFSPNGYHLMCMEPKAGMKPGNTVPVTLSFQGGGKLTATFAVRNAARR